MMWYFKSSFPLSFSEVQDVFPLCVISKFSSNCLYYCFYSFKATNYYFPTFRFSIRVQFQQWEATTVLLLMLSTFPLLGCPSALVSRRGSKDPAVLQRVKAIIASFTAKKKGCYCNKERMQLNLSVSYKLTYFYLWLVLSLFLSFFFYFFFLFLLLLFFHLLDLKYYI